MANVNGLMDNRARELDKPSLHCSTTLSLLKAMCNAAAAYKRYFFEREKKLCQTANRQIKHFYS